MECLDKTIDSAKELNKWIRMTDSLVIYGAGDYGKQMTDYLFFINEDQRIKKIVVTEKGNESEYRGKDIWSSDEFLNRDKECIVLIAATLQCSKFIAQWIGIHRKHHFTHEITVNLAHVIQLHFI